MDSHYPQWGWLGTTGGSVPPRRERTGQKELARHSERTGQERTGQALTLPGGRWRLALLFADPAPNLSRDGRYAIRLASEGISFDEAWGWNVLAEDVEWRSNRGDLGSSHAGPFRE